MLLRKHFSPVFFGVPVLLFLVLCSSFLQNPSAKAVTHVSYARSQVSLTPDEIVARAREWVAAKVTYSMKVQPQYRFQNYRADCSGLVAMAWGIPSTPPNYGLYTGSLSNVADMLGNAVDDAGQPIIATMNKLQKGDILLNQGSDAHVILFVGWIDITKKMVVDHPIRYTDGKYYYDGIEENYGYGYALEHTPNYPVDTQPFDFHQPWPFPYDPGFDPGGYYAWRFDLAKATQLGYIGQGSNNTPIVSPPATTKPGGQWISPPSPKNGDTVTDVIHLSAQAYPTHQGDPPISLVYFTIGSNGSWRIVCTVPPPTTGNRFACDVNLKNVGISYGQIQASFDVYDKAGNINLAPNGVHTLTYIPTPKPVPTPTQPLTLEVKPSSIDASNPNVCPNGKCEMTLSNPSSNTSSINWKATITIRAGAGTGIIGSVSPSSGTLAPGQVITVSFIISSFICGDITGSTITFTGGVSPVVVQLAGSFGPC